MRTVGVKLMADISQYTTQMRNAGKQARDFAGELDRAAKAGRLDAVADQAAMLGAGMVGLVGVAGKFAADFEKQMSHVKAATKASAKEMDQLRKAALQAGADTQFSATEAGKGIEELAKAGISTANILGGGLKGALDLAAAGTMDVGDAAEVAASAMQQFKLKGSDVPHIADLLAAGAGKAQGSVHDMGMALNQAGLVAAQMGLSVEDTVGTLTSFASAGLLGSDAGTSLKTAMLMLANPTEKAQGLMEELGIQTYNAQGQFIGISELAGQLKGRLGALTQEQRNAALATIFGSDAIRAASILYEQGQDGIDGWIKKVDDSGYAAETAKTKTDNLIGDLERLKGSIESLAIESASASNSGLRTLVQGVERLVDGMAMIPGPVQSTIVVMAAVGGAMLLAGAAAAKLKRGTADMLQELSETGPRGQQAARGLERVQNTAARAAIALAALQTASALMGTSTNPQVTQLANDLDRFRRSGELAGEAARLMGSDFENFRYDVNALDSGFWAGLDKGIAGTVEGFTGLGNVMDQSLTKATERLAAYDGALAEMVNSGRSQEAAEVFRRMAVEAAKSGVSVDELKKGFPQYAAALDAARTATTGATGATGQLAGGMSDLAGKAGETEKAVEDLQKAFDQLFGAQMSADRANMEYKDGLIELRKELKDGTRTLDQNTVEGRKNVSSVLDQIDRIKDLRDARVAQGEQMDSANKKYGRELGDLKATLRQMGYNKKQVDTLVGAYEQIPGRVATNVSTTGVGGVRAQLANLVVLQQALRKGVSMGTARAQAGDAAAARDRGLFHAGGYTGPGGKYEPAGTVHREEFVIRQESTKKLRNTHPGWLEELNATGQLPGYARGGLVQWPFPATARGTRVPTRAQAIAAVTPSFGNWPPGPGAQRGDSGVWRGIVQMIRATGPLSGEFGNGYRHGDPLWHGSGRAVDWMGYNQDALSRFLAAKRPLELIHRTRNRDYAYSRGVNRGSFNNALMEAHRNHIHIAMRDGGTIREPVLGVGASGATYSFGEDWKPERVSPMYTSSQSGGGGTTLNVTISGPVGSQYELKRWLTGALQDLKHEGRLP